MVKNNNDVIFLCSLLPKYAKKFDDLTDSEFEKDRLKGIKYSKKWNKIRKIIEFQEEKIC